MPTKSTTPSAPAKTTIPTPIPPITTNGFLDTVDWWNKNHSSTSISTCTQQGDTPVGTERAWRVDSNSIACYDDTAVSAWSGHMVNVNIYFSVKVSEQQALASAISILPKDTTQTNTYSGTNPSYSAIPSGACKAITYSSSTVGSTVKKLNPSWSADPNAVTVVLYSGQDNSQDGSTGPYSSTAINLASVGIGPENRGSDGVVHC